MSIAVNSPSSEWLSEVGLQLYLGRHVLVTGAERDRALSETLLSDAADALAGNLSRLWFSEVLRWSPSQDPHVETARDDVRTGSADSPNEDIDEVALATLARLSVAQEPLALIIEAADLLCARMTSIGFDALRRMLALPVSESGAMRTAVIALAEDPDRLPVQLRGDARLAHVRARLPGSAVRRAAMRSMSAQFEGWSDGPALRELVGLTDGMTLAEIEALSRFSQEREVPMREPRKLMAGYRAGLDVDPWDSLDGGRLDDIAQTLRERILGQEHVLQRVQEMLRMGRVGLDYSASGPSGARRPRVVMFLAGPTGVGKTELIRTLAYAVFGDRNAVIRLDMAEFQQGHSGERLGGAPPGYIGYGDRSIADRVAERPFSVVLFDEIEKASPELWDRLLAIVDDGRLTDGRGNTVSFGDTIVAFTSNLGAAAVALSGAPSTATLLETCRAEVKRHMEVDLGRPELWGRLAHSVIAFDALRPPTIAPLVAKLAEGLRESAHERYAIELDIDVESVGEAVKRELAAERDGTWNGRTVRMKMDPIVMEPLARVLVKRDFRRSMKVRVEVRDGQTVCEIA